MPRAMLARPMAMAERCSSTNASTAPAMMVPNSDGRNVTVAIQRRRYARKHSRNIAFTAMMMQRTESRRIWEELSNAMR